MKHRILVLALSLAVLLVTAVPALAQEGAPTPPEGMMGITSVTESDPLERPTVGEPAVDGNLVTEELVYDKVIAESGIADLKQSPVETTADTTSIGQPAGKAKGESDFTPIYGAAAVVILLGVFGAVRLRASKN